MAEDDIWGGDDGLFDVFDSRTTSKVKPVAVVKESASSTSTNRKRKLGEEGPLEPPPPKKRKINEEEAEEKLSEVSLKDMRQIANTNPQYWSNYQEQVKEELTYEGCVHKVAYPPGNGNVKKFREECLRPLNIEKPAREFPYVLDPFQQCAVECLHRGHDVLVAAHTSAGKTTVAEYGIALGLQKKSRVIYTSPIKALSNQKYRDLKGMFQDVGLMTGDVTINPDASCLVMTTEILRNMLYRGSQIVREISYVIFDEIHYMKDIERGVVWEEVLILTAQHNLSFIFLSATIPNSIDFAGWISKLSLKPCHVVYTEYRPVPLVHYICPQGQENIFQVVDTAGKFKQENFQKAIASLQAGKGSKNKKGGSKGKKVSRNEQTGHTLQNLIKMLVQKGNDPIIVFAFSRKECEQYASQLTKLDLCNETEKALVTQVFNSAMDSLSPDDRQLPQVHSLLHFLKLGIGVHHSGLLPILKEVVELLFGEGLVKCLFATETFAMGINMPARTVIFSSVTKYDGKRFRLLSCGEYVQMSGRAGRRGKDAKGFVIMMIDGKMEPADAQNMLRGTADPIHSEFHLGYNMLLNLTRIEGGEPTHLIHRSFLQFTDTLQTPAIIEELEELEKQYGVMEFENEAQVSRYYDHKVELEQLHSQLREFTNDPEHMLPFLNPGRVLHIVEHEANPPVDWGWGLFINFEKVSKHKLKHLEGKGIMLGDFLVHVLLPCQPTGLIAHDQPRPFDPKSGAKCEMQVIPCQIKHIHDVSALKLKNITKDLKKRKQRQKIWKTFKKMRKNYGKEENIPLIHPIEDMEIDDKKFKKTHRKWEKKRNEISQYLTEYPTCDLQYEEYKEKKHLQIKKQILQNKLGDLQKNRELQRKLRAMNQILRRLGYTNTESKLNLKGCVACEISSGNELVATELLFNGVFRDLNPAQIASLFSCFAFQEKTTENPKLPESLSIPFKILTEVIKNVIDVTKDAGLEIDGEAYLSKFQPHIMVLTYQWCHGAKFIDICKMTNILEGSIVRAMRRLEEILGELQKASRQMGNEILEGKFKEARKLMTRDIVFAASLYLV